ncbi:MAG: arginine N-succinyltransferase [Pseudomonadota bacterium]
MLIRPITLADIPAIESLISIAGVGITTLTNNRASLKKRVELSLASFQKTVSKRGEEQYLFVLDDTAKGHIAGICAVTAGVGLTEAFYSYRIGTEVHASKALKVHKTFPALHLCNDYTGYTELGSLYLDPDYRGGINGKLLSKSRFLFLAQFPERFAEKVIAELRGVSNKSGYSPFWESLGKHFFSMEFSEADYLVGIGNRSFIAELMPKHPIYVVFLSQQAQRVIGEVHKNTLPARKILEREGFRHEGYVDIFDAGPTLECRLKEIRAVKKSRTVNAKITEETSGDELCLVSNTRLQGFRCCIAKAKFNAPESLEIDKQTAADLMISSGEKVRVVRLEPDDKP